MASESIADETTQSSFGLEGWLLNICIQIKVDRLQIIVVTNKYIYVSQLFISRIHHA